jgi:sugar diacid utilization regulator
MTALESIPFQPRAEELTPQLREAHLEMVDAVLGGDGLERVAMLAAAAAGGPVVIVAPGLGGPWVAPFDHLEPLQLAALERDVMELIADPTRHPPAAHLELVPIAAGARTVGAVVLLRADEPPAASALDFLHLAAVAALTQAAITEAGRDAEFRLRGSLLEQLRGSERLDAAEIVRQGARLGCELTRGGIALCAEVPDEHAANARATVADECPQALAEYGEREPASGTRRLYILIPGPAEPDDLETMRTLARRVTARLRQRFPVGRSAYFRDPAELARAMQDAELMLDILLESGAPSSSEFKRSWGYRLLLRVLASHPEEVHLLYQDTIAPLVGYDDQYHTDLVSTLETYLAHNANMNATAAAVFAHRHTVAYRLERIKELTGLDPGLSEDRERLGLGLKAYRMMRVRLPVGAADLNPQPDAGRSRIGVAL